MRPRVRGAWTLCTSLVILVLSACGLGGGSSSQTSSSGEADSAPTVAVAVTVDVSEEASGATNETPIPDGSPRVVTFETEDGITLSGTLFGLGDTAVVFSHMFSTDQTSWHHFAQTTADLGYVTLTYDFRGYGESAGTQDIPAIERDVRAAYEFVRTEGAGRVVLVGADTGGIASIKVAANPAVELAGLIVLASPREFQGLEATQAELDALTMPTLWLSARTDLVTAQLEEMHAGAAGPDKNIWIFEGSGAHGTFIFDAPLDAEDLERRLLDFLARVAPLS